MYNSGMIKTKVRRREDGSQAASGGKTLKKNWKTVVEILTTSKPASTSLSKKI